MITHSGILREFSSVSLDGIDGVSLMSRIDSKYLFHISMLGSLLSGIIGDYKVLEIDGRREFNYNTVYYDTADYTFFNQHLRGRLERDKVRLRTYDSNGLSYLEVKHKTNKGRTTKTRIKSSNVSPLEDARVQKFLREKIEDTYQSLKPTLLSQFTRITLVNFIAAERVTIDYNITYSNNENIKVELPYIAIAEVKRDKESVRSVMHSRLKQMGIHQTGFSKYCLGVAMLNGVPKINNIKPVLLKLNRIKDEITQNDRT